MSFKALTLDLDDTLWPIAPTIQAAEAAANAWFAEHAPVVLEAWNEGGRLLLRNRVVAAFPNQRHDLGFLRREMFRQMLADCGLDDRRAAEVYEVFIAERQRVTLYPGALAALEKLAARYPLAAVSNGNADLARIGLDQHFRFSLSAGEHGAAKPDPGIYLAACKRLGIDASEVLHVGDDPHTDVLGARRAGLRAAWINAEGTPWEHDEHAPEIEAASFAELVERLLLR
ncbi:HAD family hydrolase [Nevskia ramosa]|uniref:HAD family hydrolase n=1 Tax=Nevskia ramosa TaxID=64002 RepID=UPI003D102032